MKRKYATSRLSIPRFKMMFLDPKNEKKDATSRLGIPRFKRMFIDPKKCVKKCFLCIKPWCNRLH